MTDIDSHIVSVLPTPSKTLCDTFDKTIHDFILGKISEGALILSIVTEAILYASKSKMGLGWHWIR